jgi:hypothetical protein
MASITESSPSGTSPGPIPDGWKAVRKNGRGLRVIFCMVAENKLVSKHILRAVKDWSSGNEALAGQRKPMRCRDFLCGRSGFHSSSIGVAAQELQGERQEAATDHFSNVLDVENLRHSPLAQWAVS